MLLYQADAPGAVLEEMTRIVRPGGKVIVADLDQRDVIFLETEHHDRWMGVGRTAVEGWFEKAGLFGVKVFDLGEECRANSSRGEGAEAGMFAAMGSKPTDKIIK
jgi:hypothetical protein